ncbi:5998_t:CDS:2, partial [Acaulospora colombiana]
MSVEPIGDGKINSEVLLLAAIQVRTVKPCQQSKTSELIALVIADGRGSPMNGGYDTSEESLEGLPCGTIALGRDLPVVPTMAVLCVL